MKAKTVIVLLIFICLALGAALMLFKRNSQKQKDEAENRRNQLSNSWVKAEANLTDQKKVNVSLETNLAMRVEEVKALSNDLAAVSSRLVKVEADAKAAAQTAKEEIAKRDTKITGLETQRDDLTKRMEELNVSISSLEDQIADTENKLAASEGDRTFLLRELKRLQTEKAELERQFNNLAVLREQVRKLREELSIARRIEWLRRGFYGLTDQKGAERLQQGLAPPPTLQPKFPLDVELRTDEPPVPAPTLIPVPAPTNAPPGNPAPVD